MKTPSIIGALTASLFTLIVFTPDVHAQIPGGFSAVSEKDAGVLAAAKSGVAAHDPKLTLKVIEKVERQVVAGLNYRFTLKVSDGGKIRRADAVVWRKLDGTHQLTSWKWLDAAPAPAGI